MKFLDLKYEAFGMDINDLSLKIAKLEKNQGNFFVSSFCYEKIKPGTVEGGIIKNEKELAEIMSFAYNRVKGKKLKTKYVVASLPEEESFLQVVQMPKMSEKDLSSAIVFEMENYIPLPVSQVYLDFQIIKPINDGADHLDVLVVATPKRIVDSYVSCIKSAKLIPIAFEVESQSIIRALVKKETSEYPLVIIDLGENNTDFIVFSGNSIRFTCSISTSQNQLATIISEAFKISLAEAETLKNEYGVEGRKETSDSTAQKIFQVISPVLDDFLQQIRKYIDFYQQHASHEHLALPSQVKKIALCGGGANMKGFTEFLKEKLFIDAEVGSSAFDLFVSRNNKFGNPDFLFLATVFGLAERGINIEKEKLI